MKTLKMAILATAFLSSSVLAEDAITNVFHESYKDWNTATQIDTFDEDTVGAYIVTSGVNNGGFLSLDCNGRWKLYTAGTITKSLGDVWSSSTPIKVKVDVGTTSFNFNGKYPNSVAVDKPLKLVSIFLLSNTPVRIRTKHKTEFHSFTLSSSGFTSAKVWLDNMCKVIK